MRLYRVFPWLRTAAETEPGHPLYLLEQQGAGRADNADRYRTLYLSSAPAGAVAEAFGSLKLWTPNMFIRPDLPGSVRALAAYELPDAVRICDLDDAKTLDALGLKPSQVVSADRAITQRWALTIHERRRWGGVRWWSRYDSRWYSYALWDLTDVTVDVVATRELSIDDAAVVEAAEILRRPRVER